MAFSVQDSETGEMAYMHRHMFSIEPQYYDLETGEPLRGTELKVHYLKHDNFHIPKKYLRGTETEEMDKTIAGICNDDFCVKQITSEENKSKATDAKQYKKEDFMNMDGVKNDILLGYTKDTYIIFLIPTLFCCTITLGFILLLIEAILHWWTHKKNLMNMNKSFYFRSPLHLLTSQFCLTCRRESEIKIFQTINKQKRKARQPKALKEVSKAIS